MKLQLDEKFNFKDLFVFEMANNHQGSVAHGLRIINEMADVAEKSGIRAAIKLQFRDLDTFIHPDHFENKEAKHISRFLSTRLNEEEFGQLVTETKKRGLITMCTPFDEASVDKIIRLGIEIIKIGSCSAQDWPLLERVAEVGKPVIISTGGLTLKEMDKIVSFFEKRAVHFAMMHCVGIYPTPNNAMHLNQIEVMRNRYPHLTIGFSTHEEPDNLTPIRVAYAKGARIYERHIGVATDEIKLNAYSSTPKQTSKWIEAQKEAAESCGSEGVREVSEKELADLKSLMRGVYARRDIAPGAPISRDDVFFAMPLIAGQLVSGRFVEGLIADKEYKAKEAISSVLRSDKPTKKDIIYHTIHAVKGMLNDARIPIGHDFAVELSHHYGLENFHEFGCVLIECVTRESYSKKLIIQLPGQRNPEHYHQKKDETFQILQGTLIAWIDGKKKVLNPGDTLWVPRGVLHGFGTETGVIFEEVGGVAMGSDSYYVDRNVSQMSREDRKTRLLNWGRHQFDLFTDDGKLRQV